MKTKIALIKRAALLVLLSTLNAPLSTFAQGTAFMYEGRLTDGGSLANGVYDLQFTVWDRSAGGFQAGSTVAVDDLPITNGLFTVTVDPGPGVFRGPPRWFEIGVRPGASSGTYTFVQPRQAILPSPYAILATSISGTVEGAQLVDGTVTGIKLADGAVTNFKLADNSVTPPKLADLAVINSKLADGAVTAAKLASASVGTTALANDAVTSGKIAASAVGASQLAANSVFSSKIVDGSIISADIADGSVMPADLDLASFSSTFWKANGNAGTTPGTHFVGTTDNQPLEFKVNGMRALRLENNGDSSSNPDGIPDGAPNVIGGSPGNFVGAGVVGATIAGGGATNYVGSAETNSVRAEFGAVGGGSQNSIGPGAASATIAGGYLNAIGTNATRCTIGGGQGNQILANAEWATIAGGLNNTIGKSSSWSTIAGGDMNLIYDNSAYGMIPGGTGNTATNAAFAAGLGARADHTGAFVWSGDGGASSTVAHSVTFRASGGYRFFTRSGNVGAELAAGATSWTVLSDRNVKKDFVPVDGRAILEKLATLPITRWHYQWEETNLTAHIGPMAQDFKAAFYSGRDDKGITTLEFDGVELAAIQGLNQKLSEQEAVLKEKVSEIQELRQAVAELQKTVRQITHKTQD